MRAWMLVVATVGCGKDAPTPDGSWEVTVTTSECSEVEDAWAMDPGTLCVTDCTEESSAGVHQTFVYDAFFDGSATELKIKEEAYATGVLSGCSLTYQSPIWLEERGGGKLQWQIEGEAEVQGAAGGCDIAMGYDWLGTEVITIVESEDESIIEDCTYTMAVYGSFLGADE